MAVGPGMLVILVVAVNTQPFESFTVTEYEPAVNPDTGLVVVKLGDAFKANEYVGVPPVTAPIVILPLDKPQVVFAGVKANPVGPGVIVNVADTVNVQPKLLVNVITGVPAPKPVTV